MILKNCVLKREGEGGGVESKGKFHGGGIVIKLLKREQKFAERQEEKVLIPKSLQTLRDITICK